MIRANEFAKDMCRQLSALTHTKWECGHGVGNGQDRVDVYGEPGGKPVYIEIELRRNEPVTNVIKLWKAAKERRVKKGFILVQAFSGNYLTKDLSPTRVRAHAEFIGGQMNKSCGAVYMPVPFDYHPRKSGKVGSTYRRLAAQKLAKQVIQNLSEEKLILL